jgi:hypothetical protein
VFFNPYLYKRSIFPSYHGKTSIKRKNLRYPLRPPEPRRILCTRKRSTQETQMPVLQLLPSQTTCKQRHLGMQKVHKQIHRPSIHNRTNRSKTGINTWLNTNASHATSKLTLPISKNASAAHTAEQKFYSKNAYAQPS